MADEAVADAEHEREAERPEEQRAQARVDDALLQDVDDLAGAGEAGLEHHEAGLHEEHEERGDEHPRRVGAVDRPPVICSSTSSWAWATSPTSEGADRRRSAPNAATARSSCRRGMSTKKRCRSLSRNLDFECECVHESLPVCGPPGRRTGSDWIWRRDFRRVNGPCTARVKHPGQLSLARSHVFGSVLQRAREHRDATRGAADDRHTEVHAVRRRVPPWLRAWLIGLGGIAVITVVFTVLLGGRAVRGPGSAAARADHRRRASCRVGGSGCRSPCSRRRLRRSCCCRRSARSTSATPRTSSSLVTFVGGRGDRQRPRQPALDRQPRRADRTRADAVAAQRLARPAQPAELDPRARRPSCTTAPTTTRRRASGSCGLIVDETRRLDRIVDNLLSLSRLQAGALDPDERADVGERARRARADRGSS